MVISPYVRAHVQGISLSSLMYVTKRNMVNAVATMIKHLEHVQDSLAVSINNIIDFLLVLHFTLFL
jgi:hypothetical protein